MCGGSEPHILLPLSCLYSDVPQPRHIRRDTSNSELTSIFSETESWHHQAEHHFHPAVWFGNLGTIPGASLPSLHWTPCSVIVPPNSFWTPPPVPIPRHLGSPNILPALLWQPPSWSSCLRLCPPLRSHAPFHLIPKYSANLILGLRFNNIKSTSLSLWQNSSSFTNKGQTASVYDRSHLSHDFLTSCSAVPYCSSWSTCTCSLCFWTHWTLLPQKMFPWYIPFPSLSRAKVSLGIASFGSLAKAHPSAARDYMSPLQGLSQVQVTPHHNTYHTAPSALRWAQELWEEQGPVTLFIPSQPLPGLLHKTRSPMVLILERVLQILGLTSSSVKEFPRNTFWSLLLSDNT